MPFRRGANHHEPGQSARPWGADAADRIAQAARANLAMLFERLAPNTRIYLQAAAAPNDPVARESLRNEYDGLRAGYAALYQQFADGLGRVFDDGYDARTMATVLTALADGFLLLRRFAPGHADPELYAETAIRIFDAITTPEIGAVDRRTARQRIRDEASGRTVEGLLFAEHADHDRLVAVALELYDGHGVGAVTVSNVAAAAGVGPLAVETFAVDDLGLSAVVWEARWLGGLLEATLRPDGEPSASLDETLALLTRSVHADAVLAARFVAAQQLSFRTRADAMRHRALDRELARLAGVAVTSTTPPYTQWAIAHLLQGDAGDRRPAVAELRAALFPTPQR